MSTKSIQVRLDPALKKRVERVLGKIGVDLPTAVRIFFMRVVATGSIPFPLQAEEEDHYTPAQIRKLDRLMERVENGKEKLYGPFSSAEALLEDLHKR